jgi:hypothetical protein
MWRLPSLPNLPSGEQIYDVGGTISDSLAGEVDLNKLDSVSRRIDVQGDLKADADGIKANKDKIQYNGNTKRIQSRIEENRGTMQEDLEAGELRGQPPRQPDARSFGFQYQSPLLGRIGFDALVRKPNEQTQE